MSEKKEGKKIVLKVNGEDIPMAPFVKSILNGTVKGFVEELNGCENAEKIEILIEE